MLSLPQILAQYPAYIQNHKESILKEYLQYKILNSIYSSSYGQHLVFLGGTALRIIHGNTRFSEDLDFDNLGLTRDQFTELGTIIKHDLELEGLHVEISLGQGNAYRLKIKIPHVLFDAGITPLPTQKILIQVDTVPQNFTYTPEQPLLNMFEILRRMYVAPKDILLSQKIYASTNRPRAKGRDFFDITFLYGIGAKPHFDYLKKNIDVSTDAELWSYLMKKTADLDFSELAEDVKPFLFYPQDADKVLHFKDFIQNNLK